MTDYKKTLVQANITIREALVLLDQTALQILLVVDAESKLLGTITDGDIRRGVLKGMNLDESIESIVFKAPTMGYINESNQEIIKKAVAKKLHQIPLVDAHHRVIGLKEIDELLKPVTGAGAVVIRDVGSEQRVVGVPARRID